MKKMEWQATRGKQASTVVRKPQSTQMVVIYRRKQRGHSWMPWRAVSHKEALRILEQPHDQELKLGGTDGL